MNVYTKVRGIQILAGTVEEKTFLKTVKLTEHLFRKRDAWCVDVKVFNEWVVKYCKKIVITDVEDKKIYVTTPEIFLEKGFYINIKNWNPQYGLERMFFNVYDAITKKLIAAECSTEPVTKNVELPIQNTLF